MYEVDLEKETILLTGPQGKEEERKIQSYDKVVCYAERASSCVHVVLLDSENKRVDYARLN